MSDKTLKIILGIIAINLTTQTVKDVGVFPTAFAQGDIQKVAICDERDGFCATVFPSINSSAVSLFVSEI